VIRTALIIYLSIIATPVSAEWKVASFIDRMSDKLSFYGIAAAKLDDRGVSAALRIGCMNGAPMLSTELSAPLTRGQIGGVYRIDDGPQQMRMMRVFSDPNSIPLLDITPGAISKAKRMRLQLQPTGGPALFYDFDVSGASAVLEKVKC
jgi:hypothetical protein